MTGIVSGHDGIIRASSGRKSQQPDGSRMKAKRKNNAKYKSKCFIPRSCIRTELAKPPKQDPVYPEVAYLYDPPLPRFAPQSSLYGTTRKDAPSPVEGGGVRSTMEKSRLRAVAESNSRVMLWDEGLESQRKERRRSHRAEDAWKAKVRSAWERSTPCIGD